MNLKLRNSLAFSITLISLGCLVSCTSGVNTSAGQAEDSVPKLNFSRVELANTNSYRALHWINDSLVILGGSNGSILFSADAGTSWQAINPPDSLDFRSVWAKDKNYILLAAAGQPANVYLTENGGKDWQITYQDTSGRAFFDAIHMLNNKVGFAFSDPVDGEFLLLETGDGGKSWEKVSNLPPPLPGEAGFAASNASLASGGGKLYLATGGQNSRILVSDMVNDWTAIANPARYRSEAGGIYALAATNGNITVGIGGAYDMPNDTTGTGIYTTDGGKSWQLAHQPPGGYRSGIDWLPNTDIFVSVGTNGSDITYDGGLTWQSLNTLNLNTIQFNPSGTRGIAAGSKGELYTILFTD
jgi:photosystem II stability/assembly factor-like uncharacterized protein